MTPEEIDAMPAGREMDALVAERCLGWNWRKPNQNWDSCWLYPPGLGCFPAAVTDERRGLSHYADRYSTKIAAAWPLVERYGMRVTAPLSPGGPLWTVEHRDGETDAPTAPLAICRAALKAALAGGEA